MIGPPSMTSIDDVMTPDGECEEPRGNVGRVWRRFFMEVYGRALRSGVCKGLVLLVFACYVAVAVWGCLQMRAGMRLVYLTPTDSYLRVNTRAHTHNHARTHTPLPLSLSTDLLPGV